jgi:hypothetical protein
MGEQDNEIRISITLDDGTVREGFARIKKEGEDSGKGMAEAFAHVKAELLAVIAAYVGFEAIKHTLEESITAAMAYESALNQMNKSLYSAGEYTAQASQSFMQLAKAMEHTTALSEEQILSLEGLSRNYARTNDQAKALTKAAIDLGAATGKGPETALRELGQTLDGTAGRLGKMIPALKNMTEMQLRAGDAIGVVSQRFKDAASADANTFVGTINRLKNSFEDLSRELGFFITQSPALRAVFEFIGKGLRSMAESLAGVRASGDIFKTIIDVMIAFAQGINTYVIAPTELVYNVVKTAFDGVVMVIQGALALVYTGLAKFFEFLNPKGIMATQMREMADTTTEVFDGMVEKTGASARKILDFNVADGVKTQLDELQAAVDNAKPFAQLQNHVNETKENLYGLSGPLTSVGQGFSLMAAGAKNEMLKLRNDAVKYMQEIGSAVTKTFAGGVANAMAAVGRAMVKGQDIFQAFAGAMLSAIGQACLQMGAAYIMMGIARVATSYGADPTGWTLIGVGSGMSVLGGALMALGEGMSGSGGAPDTSAASGGAGGGAGGAPMSGNPAEQVSQEKKSQVEVNIHGSVFDSRETGLRIVELVNDAFSTQGAAVIVK